MIDNFFQSRVRNIFVVFLFIGYTYYYIFPSIALSFFSELYIDDYSKSFYSDSNIIIFLSQGLLLILGLILPVLRLKFVNQFYISSKRINIYGLLTMASFIFIYYAYLMKNELFLGYTSNIFSEFSYRSQISSAFTLYTIFFIFLIDNTKFRGHKSHFAPKFFFVSYP